jgi:hypothetical protein
MEVCRWPEVGDAPLWGAALLMQLLRQRPAFELTDIGCRLLFESELAGHLGERTHCCRCTASQTSFCVCQHHKPHQRPSAPVPALPSARETKLQSMHALRRDGGSAFAGGKGRRSTSYDECLEKLHRMRSIMHDAFGSLEDFCSDDDPMPT